MGAAHLDGGVEVVVCPAAGAAPGPLRAGQVEQAEDGDAVLLAHAAAATDLLGQEPADAPQSEVDAPDRRSDGELAHPLLAARALCRGLRHDGSPFRRATGAGLGASDGRGTAPPALIMPDQRGRCKQK
jgi:hypothetical protein